MRLGLRVGVKLKLRKEVGAVHIYLDAQASVGHGKIARVQFGEVLRFEFLDKIVYGYLPHEPEAGQPLN